MEEQLIWGEGRCKWGTGWSGGWGGCSWELLYNRRINLTKDRKNNNNKGQDGKMIVSIQGNVCYQGKFLKPMLFMLRCLSPYILSCQCAETCSSCGGDVVLCSSLPNCMLGSQQHSSGYISPSFSSLLKFAPEWPWLPYQIHCAV